MTNDSRLVQVKMALGVGRTWVHVLNFYAPNAERYDALFTTREKMFENLFLEAATLGNVPVLIVGDWNVPPDPSESPTLTLALASGWLHDCAVMSADMRGTVPDYTARTQKETGVVRTRIDHVWANSTAAAALSRCHAASAVLMPVHCPVDALFHWDIYSQLVSKLFAPRKFELRSAPHSKQLLLDAKELATRQYREERADPAPDIHQAMERWGRDAELVCERFATGDVSRALGKSRPPDVRTVHLEVTRSDCRATFC